MIDITRQKTIDYLYYLKTHYPKNLIIPGYIDFAISSLEADEAYQLEYEKPELCEDCISRFEVTEILNSEYDKDKMFDRVDELPNVLPEVKWIPIKDRMPSITGYYLIQYTRAVCADEMAVAFYSVEEKELDPNYTWEFKTNGGDCKEVIAWMSLPEPYNMESEDNNA